MFPVADKQSISSYIFTEQFLSCFLLQSNKVFHNIFLPNSSSLVSCCRPTKYFIIYFYRTVPALFPFADQQYISYYIFTEQFQPCFLLQTNKVYHNMFLPNSSSLVSCCRQKMYFILYFYRKVPALFPVEDQQNISYYIFTEQFKPCFLLQTNKVFHIIFLPNSSGFVSCCRPTMYFILYFYLTFPALFPVADKQSISSYIFTEQFLSCFLLQSNKVFHNIFLPNSSSLVSCCRPTKYFIIYFYRTVPALFPFADQQYISYYIFTEQFQPCFLLQTNKVFHNIFLPNSSSLVSCCSQTMYFILYFYQTVPALFPVADQHSYS